MVGRGDGCVATSEVTGRYWTSWMARRDGSDVLLTITFTVGEAINPPARTGSNEEPQLRRIFRTILFWLYMF